MTDYGYANIGKLADFANNTIGGLTANDIMRFPRADVQPVKHGTWRKDEQGYDVYVECSECGLNLSICNYIENEWRETLKYCPCCGARMDGDAE